MSIFININQTEAVLTPNKLVPFYDSELEELVKIKINPNQSERSKLICLIGGDHVHSVTSENRIDDEGLEYFLLK